MLVYSLADPARPARTATVTGLLVRAKFPDGQSQPDEVLCTTCIWTGEAVAFPPDGHTLTVIVNRTEMSANSGRDTIFDWPVTGSGTLGTATVTARDAADSQPFIAPSDRTVLGSPSNYHWRTWPLPCPAQLADAAPGGITDKQQGNLRGPMSASNPAPQRSFSRARCW